MKGNPSPYNRPETIDETAEMIVAAGGTAIPVRVDHRVEVEALFALVDREHRRPDIVADSVGGEDPLMGAYGWFWTADFTNAAKALENSLLSHIITPRSGGRRLRGRRGSRTQHGLNTADTSRDYSHLSRGDQEARSGSFRFVGSHSARASVILATVNAGG